MAKEVSKNHIKKSPESKKKRSWLRPLKGLILAIPFLIVLMGLLIQIPFFQNWLIKQYTDKLSEQLQTVVSIDRVNLNIYKGLELENVYIEDLNQDTLLHSNSFFIGLEHSLFSLFKKRLSLDDLALEDTQFNLRTVRGDSISNLQRILNNLSSKSSTKKTDSSEGSNPLIYDLNSLDLKNVSFLLEDQNKGKHQLYQISEGDLIIKEIDQLTNTIEIEELSLDRPYIEIFKRPKETLFNTNIEKLQEAIDSTIQVPADTSAFLLHKLKITNGVVKVYDETKQASNVTDVIDYNRLDIDNLNLDIDSINFLSHIDLSAHVNHFSFETKEGFKMEELKSRDVKINSKMMAFPSLYLKTNKSIIKESVAFRFNSFEDLSDFANRVFIEADFNNSTVALSDFSLFAQDIKNNPFFKRNANKTIYIDGEIRGRVANLKGNNIILRMDNDLALAGSFSSRNLNDPGEELLNFTLDYLQTDIRSLRRVIPGFSPPSNFDKLNKIRFEGRFDGYFSDFVANGKMKTDLGSSDLDMRLNIYEGRSKAEYSGELNLIAFDLGKWSDNSDLGILNLSTQVSEGNGLTLETADAKLDGRINSLDFKGYTYENVILDGNLNKNQFAGELYVEDDNIDLNFNGKIEITDSLPRFDFVLDVKKIDFKALNISKDSTVVSGKINLDLRGNNIDNLAGKGEGQNLVYFLNGEEYILDTFSLESEQKANGIHNLNLFSEVIDLELNGQYEFQNLHKSLVSIIRRNYPEITKTLGVKPVDAEGLDEKFVVNAHIKDTKNFLKLAKIEDLSFNNTYITADVDHARNKIIFDLMSPEIVYKNFVAKGTNIELKNFLDIGNLILTIDSSAIGDMSFNPILLGTSFEKEIIDFSLTTTEITDTLERLQIQGQLRPKDDGYLVSISDTDWQMLGTSWRFDDFNKFYWKENYLDIENFRLTDGKRTILIDDIDNVGAMLEVDGFNLSLLNDFITYDKLIYDADVNVKVSAADVFKQRELNILVGMPKLIINGDDYGTFQLLGNSAGVNRPLNYDFSMIKEEQKLWSSGYFDLDKKELKGQLNTEDFPLSLVEYFVTSGINGTKGDVDLDVRYGGVLPDIKIDGDGYIRNGGIGIDYLGVYYTFNNQSFKMTDKEFDLTGCIMQDMAGNVANVTGGLFHDMFGGFGANATISSDKFIALNTTKEQNPLYYGFAQGPLLASFNGDFNALTIDAVGTTGDNTKLNIPIGNALSEVDESFIRIIDSDDYFSEKEEVEEEEFKLEGVTFNLDLTMTPDAETFLIFNERKGDIIKGKGRGDIQLKITREGDFTMHGDYEVVEGDYLFTAWTFVNKPFTIRPGGMINWSGDPFNAEIDIEADYEGVRASLNIFLAEYLTGASENILAEARKRTDVDLILRLQGQLEKPRISFDLDFPELVGEIRSYADSKMRVLRSNENALNDQVFGLLLFKTFLPYNNPLGNDVLNTASLLETGYNTLTEFVSNQLSLLVSGLLQEGIGENEFISGIDFEIGFSRNSFLDNQNLGTGNNAAGLTPDEVNVQLKNRFLDDRWSLIVGGDFIRGEQRALGSYVAGDFVLEYYLTEDRKLKIRAYGRYDFDEVASSRRQMYGIGISYRTEFSTLKDLKSSVEEAARELKTASQTPEGE